MPIAHMPDWDKRLARTDAFWHREVLDRPVVCMTFPKAAPSVPRPAPKTYVSQRERWFDAEYIAECVVADALNTEYIGDALPLA